MMDKRCLSDEIKDDVHAVMQFLAYGDDLYDVFNLADSVTSLYYDNKAYCQSGKLMHAIYQHCKTPTETKNKAGEDITVNTCGFGQFMHNLSGPHMIEAMGS